MKPNKTKSPVMGGSCQYNQYQGKATIESIRKEQTTQNKRYEVMFSFSPDQEIKETWVQIEKRQFRLRLHNFQNPGPKFLEKYGIKQGKIFDCYLKVITKGSCTPILFEFPTIDLDNCLENENE